MNITLFIMDYNQKAQIKLGEYKTYEEAYKEWVNLVLNYPEHEGLIGIEARGKEYNEKLMKA